MNKCNNLEILAADFIEACRQGNHLQLEISLNSDFTKHPNFKNEINNGLFLACRTGQLEIIKILTDPYFDIKKEDQITGFYFACVAEKMDIIKYFLYDLNVQLEPDFLSLNNVVPNPLKKQEIIDIIEKRDLLFKLSKDLNNKDTHLLK